MEKNNRGYGNYDLSARSSIAGFENQGFAGAHAIISELQKKKDQGKLVIVCDCYPGVDKNEIISWFDMWKPEQIVDSDECALKGDGLTALFKDYLTDDRVFGVMCHKRMEECFDGALTSRARKQIESIQKGLVLVIGTGASFITCGDMYLYFDLCRWEIQLRYRAGMSNWNCDNGSDPVLSKYKRGFFIEWRMADRYKKERFDLFDYVVDTNTKGKPNMITGAAFRGALAEMARRPFRLKPYFDPGVWGGQWMKAHLGLDQDQSNYAWSFDGVPEENSICLSLGGVDMELPCMDLVLAEPKALLGERVHGRFGAEFPIRFDLLDTMEGGNLSLQVHPLTEYIQDTFGMHYTQDESYYILDAADDACVYLGVREDTVRADMEEDLKLAESGLKAFPAEKYVNRIPVKKHDHVLIPAGTIHCSGRNSMVLEISATPYIFTFKLWDWGRAGLDGLPRPIHLKHGLANIQWDRDTKWVKEEIIHQERLCYEEAGVKIERTGLHEREFIDTYRYTLTIPWTFSRNGSVHMLNLVEGEMALIESPDHKFAPFEVHYGETFILPEAAGDYRINPVKADNEHPARVIAAWVK